MVLVVLDAYSKYPEVEIISSTAAGKTFPSLERIFATHGIPEVLKTEIDLRFKAKLSMSSPWKKVSTTGK